LLGDPSRCENIWSLDEKLVNAVSKTSDGIGKKVLNRFPQTVGTVAIGKVRARK